MYEKHCANRRDVAMYVPAPGKIEKVIRGGQGQRRGARTSRVVRAGSSVAWAPEGDMGVTVNQTELGQSKRGCLDPSGHR